MVASWLDLKDTKSRLLCFLWLFTYYQMCFIECFFTSHFTCYQWRATARSISRCFCPSLYASLSSMAVCTPSCFFFKLRLFFCYFIGAEYFFFILQLHKFISIRLSSNLGLILVFTRKIKNEILSSSAARHEAYLQLKEVEYGLLQLRHEVHLVLYCISCSPSTGNLGLMAIWWYRIESMSMMGISSPQCGFCLGLGPLPSVFILSPCLDL